MHDVGGVHKVQSPEELEHEELQVLLVQHRLGPQQARQVGGHQLKNHKHVVEAVAVARHEHVQHGYDILVGRQDAPELQLPQHPGGHGRRIQHPPDPLDRHLPPRGRIRRGAHHPIRALADHLFHPVAVVHKGRGEEVTNERLPPPPPLLGRWPPRLHRRRNGGAAAAARHHPTRGAARRRRGSCRRHGRRCRRRGRVADDGLRRPRARREGTRARPCHQQGGGRRC